MGMTASFVSVSPEELTQLQSDPEALPGLFFDRLNADEPLKGLDIDKSWAAIHFMLTGTQWGGEPPESLPVLGGAEIGEDLGYGPARFLLPSQVLQAHAVLDAMPVDKLKERFIPAKLHEADVYPSGIWLDEGEAGFEYIEHWYEQLRAFYRQAATSGNGVLLAVT